MSVSTKTKVEENMNPSSKQKSTDDGGETDAETAASTPARSSVSSPNPDLSSSSMSTKNDTGSTSLPSEINTSKSTALSSSIKVEEGDFNDWPLSDIKEPHKNDVLYGRGGGTNHHPGNKRYRKIVEGRKVDYVNSKRLDKPQVALSIIKAWRSQKPPGRFLKLDEATSLWHDVGDKKAREKTSQALREKAPLLRKQQEEQRKERENSGQAGKAEKVKNTRFDVPPQSSPSKNLKRAMLTRDHSLGREYVPAGETVSVKGFSWNSPILNEPIDEVQQSWEAPIELSRSSDSGMGQPADPYVHRDAYGVSPYSTGSSPPRYHHNGEWSSTTSAKSTAHQPHTPNDPIVSDWRTGYRTDEGVRKDYGAAAAANYDYRRSRSAPEDRYYNKRGYYPHPQAPPAPKAPSTNNSRLHSGDYERVASMVGGPPPPEPPHPSSNSNYMQSWKSMNSPRHHSDGVYDTSPYQSPDRMNPMTPSSYGHWNSPSASSHTSPPSSTMDYYNNNPYRVEGQSYPHPYSHGNNVGTGSPPVDVLPRPPTVKRDTSHKLQTVDVEPTMKRLNRQSSSGRRNTSISSIEEITDKDMNHLNVSLKRGASLGTTYSKDNADFPRKPLSLKESDRLSTIDKFLVDMDVPDSSPSQSRKPRSLVQGDRVTTIDQINTLVKDIDGTSYPLDGLSNSFHDAEDVLDDIGDMYKQNVSADSEYFGGVLASTESV